MTTLSLGPARNGWRFWGMWMLASLAGLVAYLILMSPLMIFLTGLFDARQMPLWLGMSLEVISMVGLGAAIGAAQWLVLRRVLQHTGWWVLATLAGYCLLFLLPNVLPLGAVLPESEAIGRIVGGVLFALTGIGMGVSQWLVLRGRVAHSGWWIGITLGGWVLAYLATGLMYVTGLYIEPMDMAFAFFIPIAVAGGGLVLLLRRQALDGKIQPSVF
jgi:hypothetical protein